MVALCIDNNIAVATFSDVPPAVVAVRVATVVIQFNQFAMVAANNYLTITIAAVKLFATDAVLCVGLEIRGGLCRTDSQQGKEKE